MNLAYHMLTANLDERGRAEVEKALAPPEERERVIARANEQAMKALGGFGLPPMPPKKAVE